jgi:pyruvate formate-lyase activating enzyme-like uncharacterized protein
MSSETITDVVGRIRKEFADIHDSMNWLSPEAAATASETRAALTDAIGTFPVARCSASKTKLHTHGLSPGCELCRQGTWSCLFVNGICNAHCFYCPSAQNDPGPPMANSVVFDKPRDYADFVNLFQIKGVSFSGGEPFLTFKRVLAFLETLKSQVDYPLYTWIYTNGLQVTRERLVALRDNGLDEIRFDLSANAYRLDGLERAVGIIPRVTIEIPAIPEDASTLEALMPVWERAGVDHLNLHQIRCTPFNSRRLAKRGYTFVYGPQVTVLESELTALRLIRHALRNSIDLPINYCAYNYRRQFQGAGARRRYASSVKASYEDITPTGHIRHLELLGSVESIASICQALASHGVDSTLYSLSKNGERLSFCVALWRFIDFSRVRLKIKYSAAVLRPMVSYHHAFKDISLNNSKTIVIENQTAMSGFWLDGEEIQVYGRMIQSQEKVGLHWDSEMEEFCVLKEILPFETFIEGLAIYYLDD